MSKEKTTKEKLLEEFDKEFVDRISGDMWQTTSREEIKQFISQAIDKIKEEMIDLDEELLEIGIQRILEPYFVVLDGRDNEPANETVIEISRIIISKIKQSLKSLINK